MILLDIIKGMYIKATWIYSVGDPLAIAKKDKVAIHVIQLARLQVLDSVAPISRMYCENLRLSSL